MIKLWNAITKTLRDNFENYIDKIIAMTFSFDDLIIIFASYDNTIKLWNIETKNSSKYFF